MFTVKLKNLKSDKMKPAFFAYFSSVYQRGEFEISRLSYLQVFFYRLYFPRFHRSDVWDVLFLKEQVNSVSSRDICTPQNGFYAFTAHF